MYISFNETFQGTNWNGRQAFSLGIQPYLLSYPVSIRGGGSL